MLDYEKPNGTVIRVSDNEANKAYADANGWKLVRPRGRPRKD